MGALAAVAVAVGPWLTSPAGAQAAHTGSASAGETVNVYLTTTVDESRTYQEFSGAGASFTDTAAWLFNSSGALSQSTRDEVMRKLFSPTDGIGVSFLRNPLGGSDLARFGYTFDDVPAGQTDPGLARFSINHDLADVLPLTKRARQLNPALKVKMRIGSSTPSANRARIRRDTIESITQRRPPRHAPARAQPYRRPRR